MLTTAFSEKKGFARNTCVRQLNVRPPHVEIFESDPVFLSSNLKLGRASASAYSAIAGERAGVVPSDVRHVRKSGSSETCGENFGWIVCVWLRIEDRMSAPTHKICDHFDGKSEVVRNIYDRLLTAIARFGEFAEDPKKTSIHLNRRTAFAGIATRKESLILTLKASADKASPRIRKHERASAKRWHLEVLLASPREVDHELVAWLKEAYELSA